MPTYNVKNLKNGDTLELKMSISEYEQWRKDNPDWDKDWSQATFGGTIYGEPKQSAGFKEVMQILYHLLPLVSYMKIELKLPRNW